MSKINCKRKPNFKNGIVNFNKICRCCLGESGRLRDIFSTRLPPILETCAAIQICENDGLPGKICVACFFQIARLYSFKRKLERNDKILRNYLKQKKVKETKEFSDILNKAVHDTEITFIDDNVKAEKRGDITRSEESSDEDIPCKEFSDILNKAVHDTEITFIDDDDVKAEKRGDTIKSEESSDEDIPLSERCKRDTKKEIAKNSPRLLRKSKLRANEIIDSIIKTEENEHILGNNVHNDDNREQTILLPNNLDSRLFDDPPPLVPLQPMKLANFNDFEDASSNSTLNNLPQNAPPLVPIKLLSSLNPATIINALSDNVENPVKLKLQCNICNEEFNTVFALKNHRLYQCQASGMQCNICKKEFNDRNRLIGHLKGHMVSKDYGCTICGKCYPNPSTFRVHMRTHTGERPFKCQICNKGFVRWAGVVEHMKTHNSNKPYKCETCGKGFKISSNLERHKVLHSGILPYCCSYCGKTFSQSDNLQLHVRSYHTNDRPYLCNECGKRFVSSTRLKRHMWVHTGYKPYRCRYCPKAYSNSNDRKNHEKGHTGGISEADKPHVCTTCDMRFLHACRLAKHMKTHERPYPCGTCTKTFSSDALLNKHLANKHGAQFLEYLSVPFSVEEVYTNNQ